MRDAETLPLRPGLEPKTLHLSEFRIPLAHSA